MALLRLNARDIEAILRQDLRCAEDRWDSGKLAAHGNDLLIRHESRRLASTLAALKASQTPGRILEIGAGTLNPVSVLRHCFPSAELIAVEHPRRRHVWTAAYQAQLTAERINLVAANVVRTGLPFLSLSFDMAFLMEVVEHLPPNAVPGVLTEIARVLRPGGSLVLTTPNLASWRNRENLMRGYSPGQHSPATLIDGTHPHLRLYTMNELVELLSYAGYRVENATFFDNVLLGESRLRRILTALLTPVRRIWPALQETLLILAVRG